MLIANVVSAFACLYILSCGLAALNRMSKKTALQIRIAYIGLVAGASAQLVWAFDFNYTANRISGSIFAVAVALFLWLNRRQPA